MSPAALTLAVALHALAAAALWWVSPLRSLDQTETAIMVTVEPQPSGGAPATGGAASPDQSDAASTQSAAIEAPPEEPVDAQQEPLQQALDPADPAPPPDTEAPSGPAQPSAAETPETSWPTDVGSWKPQVTFEQSLPPPEAAPSPPTSRDLARSMPQRPASKPPAPKPPPVQRAQTTPSPRPAPPAPQRAPSSDTQTAARVPAPSGSSMDSLMGHGGQRNDYLSRVARQIAQFREYPALARQNGQQGRVVMRVTITRDGRLLDASVDRSSGWPAIDTAELATIRRSGKFPDVPGSMPGDPIVLILPVTYSVR